MHLCAVLWYRLSAIRRHDTGIPSRYLLSEVVAAAAPDSAAAAVGRGADAGKPGAQGQTRAGRRFVPVLSLSAGIDRLQTVNSAAPPQLQTSSQLLPPL